MNILTVLLCYCVMSAAGLTVGEREQVCCKPAKCIWLNDYLAKHRGFPLHGTVAPRTTPHVYCYDGSLGTLLSPVIRFWDYLHVTVTTSTPKYLSMVHGNGSKVLLMGGKPVTNHNFSSSRPLLISPYEVRCLALTCATDGPSGGATYSLHAEYQLAWHFPVLFLVGCFLLFTAPVLSKNVPLLYGTGVLIGVIGSALILLYVMSRFLPARNFLGMGFLVGGYTLIASVFYWFLQHVGEYWDYALAYVIISGVISFAVLYRWGGVSDPRTLDIVRWTLQLVGLSLIYLASSLRECSILLLALVGVTYFIPLRYIPLMWPLYIVRFAVVCVLSMLRGLKIFKPSLPPWRYLTQEEYEEDAQVETKKALEKLQQDYQEGRLDISHLRSMRRFERFLSGEDHVTMEEQVSHDWTYLGDSDLDDDGNETGINSSVTSSHSSAYHVLLPDSPRRR